MYCSVLKVFEEIDPESENTDFFMDIGDGLTLAPPLGKSFSHEHCKSADTEVGYRLSTEFSVVQKSYIAVPNVLVIVSTQPLFNTFSKILQGLWAISKKRLSLPIECYIAHLVTQIPLPPKGKVVIKYKLDNQKFLITLPPCNHLPVLDINLGVLFNTLDLDSILQLFRDIVLEKSTVFISASEEKLAICTNAILGLIFPLHWNMVFVPILPHTLLDYLYSPVTFVFGVHSKHLEEIYSRVNDSVTIVDLDNNKFLVSMSQSFMRRNTLSLSSNVLPKLPEHYGKKLRKNLIHSLSRSSLAKGKLIKLANPTLDDLINTQIRQHFFQFFVSILLDYKKYVIFDTGNNNSIFNNAGFLHNCSDKEFFSAFLETQMFSNFCQSRVQPKNIEEHCEGLLFDEEIIAKQNRSKLVTTKGQIVFINDKSENHNQEYLVPDIEKVFQGKGGHKYSRFPIFSQGILEVFGVPSTKPPSYAERIETKPVIPPKWTTDDECILSLWMDLWGLFLPFQDFSEHSLRIKELFNVASQLQRSTNLSTIFIYKSLLKICFNTQPSLALEIYSFMSSEKIPADAETLQLLQQNVSKLYAKDQMILMQNTGTNMVITQAEKKEKQEIKLKRVYTKPDDIKVFAEDEVAFIVKEICKACGKVLKAEHISEKWFKGPYKYESSCYGCGEAVLPKLQVRVGLEIGYYKRKSNSIREETLFIAPFALRQLVSDLIVSHRELSLEQFRCGYLMIFWNCIWYFYQKGLPHEFLLIYDKDDNRSELCISTELISGLGSTEKVVETELKGEEIRKVERRLDKFFGFLDACFKFI